MSNLRKSYKRNSRKSYKRNLSNDKAKIIKFSRGSGNKKYCAHLSNGKKSCFGHKSYQHYYDKTPKSKGGGLYHHLDHKDSKRRSSYRSRHGAQGYQKKRNSPAYLSWKYLW